MFQHINACHQVRGRGRRIQAGQGGIEVAHFEFAAQTLPCAVLRHSILKHASRPVRVEPLYRTGIEIPLPRNERNRQKTPFSFQRFMIPEVCGYAGRLSYDGLMSCRSIAKVNYSLPRRWNWLDNSGSSLPGFNSPPELPNLAAPIYSAQSFLLTESA